MKKSLLSLLAGLVILSLHAQAPPGLSLIKEQDLKNDLYALADAHFMGRSAGTLDELKSAQWLAEKFRAIGLRPAGDDGTYFQYFNLWRNQLSDATTISINGTPLLLWRDVLVQQMAAVDIDAPVEFLGDAGGVDTAPMDLQGKVVALVANAEKRPGGDPQFKLER